MDHFEEKPRITILDHCHCVVCDKPLQSGLLLRRQRKSDTYNGLFETHFKLTHTNCDIIFQRLNAAKKKLEEAEDEIVSMEFAIFMKKTHPVPYAGI